MKNRFAVLALSLVLTTLSACAPAADESGTTTDVSITGAQEVPAVQTAATGTATATLSGTMLSVSGEFSGLSSPLVEVAGSSGHIHQAPAGSNGDVVFPLDVTMTGENSGTFSLTTELTPEQVTTYDAGGFYINFHTEMNQGGELRGQITP